MLRPLLGVKLETEHKMNLFFHADDGIRHFHVTGVQTCALPICFQQRRKQIGTLLRGQLPDGGRAWIDSLVAAGLSPAVRPEDIPLNLWQTFPGVGEPSSSS